MERFNGLVKLARADVEAERTLHQQELRRLRLRLVRKGHCRFGHLDTRFLAVLQIGLIRAHEVHDQWLDLLGFFLSRHGVSRGGESHKPAQYDFRAFHRIFLPVFFGGTPAVTCRIASTPDF